MHFVKLRLTGFKSFVDPTELHILNGLTGVVGPNGCGKSNLLEGLRWVMGETSAKSMRGSGMEDVIFAGARTRPPRASAEASLFIDNTERRAPAAFNDADAIEITRRITRDLGSNYKFNGKDIRARDAQTLFADVASGANSPALVRQGQISEIINAKAKARRRILEDAAGIAGLHARRHEALLRLNSAETNLERVVEILAQLAAREATLSREAERARNYRAISTELRQSEGMLAFRRWREAERERAHAARVIDESATIAGRAAQASAQAARRRIELEEATPRLKEEEAIARALHQRLLIEGQELEAAAREAAAAATRLATQLSQLGRDAEREAALAADAKDMLTKLEAEAEALAGVQENAEAHAAAEAALTAAQRASSETEAALTAAERAAAAGEADRRAAQQRQSDATRSLERIDAELQGLSAEVETAAAEREAAAEDIEAARLAQEEAAMSSVAADEALAAAEDRLAQAESAEREAQTELNDGQGALAAIRAEARQLEKMAAAVEGVEEPMLERVVVKRGYEAALAAAFGDDLQAGEARLDQAETAWGWLQLPPLPISLDLPKGAKPLAEFVVAPPLLTRRLAQIGVVARSRDGYQLQPKLQLGQRLVTKEGDLWRWDGFAAPAGSAASAAQREMERRNRLTELREALLEAETRAVGGEAAQAEARDDLDDARAQLDRAREARKRSDREADHAGRAALEAERRIASFDAGAQAARAAAARRAEDREDAVAQLTAAAAALAALDDPGPAGAALEELRAAAQTARQELIAAQAERDGLSAAARDRRARADAVRRDRDGWRLRSDAADKQCAALAERIAETEAALEDAQEAPEQVAEKRAELTTRLEAGEKRLAEATDALAAAESGLREVTRLEKEAEAKLAETRESRARLEERAAAAETRAEEYDRQLREAAGCAPDRFLESLGLDPEALPTVKDLEKSIVANRQARDRLGAVNLRAEDELKEVAEERAKLTSEKDELDAAIAKLRQAVAALNKEGRERLLAAFEEVNSNFEALFKHLFGGGEARLQLVDADDPLEAGLEILCQPPGKRLSLLSLLSGGEQTLTAISLIFAVFMTNPAPICVLDEVDAPLDDANVERFCGLLDEMARRTRTRFLIITHHAVTMSRMDRLFGVTMVEQGVSQLVSVDLSAAVELVDA